MRGNHSLTLPKAEGFANMNHALVEQGGLGVNPVPVIVDGVCVWPLTG